MAENTKKEETAKKSGASEEKKPKYRVHTPFGLGSYLLNGEVDDETAEWYKANRPDQFKLYFEENV